MIDLPELALAVRQPWAWAIIHGGKPLENRTVGAIKFMVPLVGRRAIHASKGMTRDEYESAREFIEEQGLICPAPAELQRGAIIGTVKVTGVVKDSTSPWFFGPRALVLEDPQPCEFVPAIGELGYFKWQRAAAAPEALPWMLKWRADGPRDLFA